MKKYTTTSRSSLKKHKLNKINRKHTATSFQSDYNVTVYSYILAGVFPSLRCKYQVLCISEK